MDIKFDKKSHTYYVNGEIAGISVTALLAKHNLAPNYSGVKSSVLKKSAEFGTIIHEEMEKAIKDAKYIPETKSAQNFMNYANTTYSGAVAEQMLAINWKGLIVAGTADIMAFRKDKKIEIADHKTTVFHRNYVTWQVNLLDYMARHLDGEINGQKFKWKGADVFKCFTYDKESGDMTIHELEKIPDSEIEALLDAELNGEFYVPKELVVKQDLMHKFKEVELTLKQLDVEKKKMQDAEKGLRKAIMDAMEQQGIKSYKDDNITITYVSERTEMVLDADAIAKQYPKIYATNLVPKHVSKCLKISVKVDENE